MALGRLLLAVAAAHLTALAAFPLLRLGRWPRACTFIALGIPILVTPLLVPAEARLLRFFAAVNAVVLLAKLYDVLIAGREKPGLRAFLAFLINPASVVLRKLG